MLRYLPTNLSGREIADQLYLSVHTVKTHQRHLYQKLAARTRTQAVQQARAIHRTEPLVPPSSLQSSANSTARPHLRERALPRGFILSPSATLRGAGLAPGVKVEHTTV